MTPSDFLDGLGSSFAYFPKLVKVVGGVTSNVLLCQLYFWQGKQRDSDGWIYKTQAEIQQETGLSRCEQETARKNLKSRGFIEERFTGIPRRLEFRLNVSRLKECWEAFIFGVKAAIAEVPEKWNRTEKEDTKPTVELEKEAPEHEPSSLLTDKPSEPSESTISQTNHPIPEEKDKPSNASFEKSEQTNNRPPKVDKFFGGKSKYDIWAERQHPALVYDAVETPWLEQPGTVQYLRFVQDFLILGGEEVSQIRGIGATDQDRAIALIEKCLNDAFPSIQYEVVGKPKDLSAAKDLANRDKYEFQWWACSLVNAQLYQGKKKGADSGIDGQIFFTDIENSKPTIKKIIVSVKGGENVGAAMVRDLRGTMQREESDIGLFVTLTPPTKPMEKEAATAGLYKAGNGREYSRVQILTIEDLLSGRKRPEYWDRSMGELTFKKAQREAESIAVQGQLF